jgi:hypothetical protein
MSVMEPDDESGGPASHPAVPAGSAKVWGPRFVVNVVKPAERSFLK